METVDLLIVGAGWHGLAMAKTYLEASPAKDINIVIVDYAESIGGTWARERLYPGLKTNNTVGSYEFSDFPLELGKYGLKHGQHIPGEIVHQYLSDFARKFELAPLIRWRTKVDAATLQDDGTWRIEYSSTSSIGGYESGASTGQLVACKLVVATGLTSEPNIPNFPGQHKFRGNFFHSKQLRSRAHDLANSRSVVVIGGNKSAWDVCYTAACAGAQVHMVMRRSGGGPSIVWRPIRIGPYKTSISSLSLTRFFTWFDPSPFGTVWKAARNFLHLTVLGRLICRLFWTGLDTHIQRVNGYLEDDRVAMLEPWTSSFWMGNSLSIHNYDTDWFDLVKNGWVVAHHANVVSLTETNVCLSDGSKLEADTIVCCTGWKSAPTIKFSPNIVASNIGLPGSSKESEIDDSTLLAMVRKQIMKQSPELNSNLLRNMPGQLLVGNKSAVNAGNPNSGKEHELQDTAPYRLYRFVVPSGGDFLELRNLAFIGAHLSIHAVMVAQAQALWITAFFQDRLPTPDVKRVRYETYLHTEYERIRRPKETGGSGGRFPDLVFDSLPYIDQLLEDLGLQTKRKCSWWRNISEPYSLRDYRGLVQEWINSKIGDTPKVYAD